jgi:hypothetical protein
VYAHPRYIAAGKFRDFEEKVVSQRAIRGEAKSFGGTLMSRKRYNTFLAKVQVSLSGRYICLPAER